MAKLRLDEKGLSKTLDKGAKLQISWKEPFVSFFKRYRVDSMKMLVDEWIEVYWNHLECFRKEIGSEVPGLNFNSLGITDHYVEYDRRVDLYLIVMDGKLIKHQFLKEEVSNSPVHHNYICLYIEGPNEAINKIYKMMSSFMSKTLETKKLS